MKHFQPPRDGTADFAVAQASISRDYYGGRYLTARRVYRVLLKKQNPRAQSWHETTNINMSLLELGIASINICLPNSCYGQAVSASIITRHDHRSCDSNTQTRLLFLAPSFSYQLIFLQNYSSSYQRSHAQVHYQSQSKRSRFLCITTKRFLSLFSCFQYLRGVSPSALYITSRDRYTCGLDGAMVITYCSPLNASVSTLRHLLQSNVPHAGLCDLIIKNARGSRSPTHGLSD